MPPILKLIWKTQNDEHVCPTCKALEGYAWVFRPGDPRPTHLTHPTYGPVYDIRPVADCSLVKEAKGCVCRCTLRQEIHFSETQADDTDIDSNEKPKAYGEAQTVATKERGKVLREISSRVLSPNSASAHQSSLQVSRLT